MTISSENRVSGPYTGNGVTTVFPFDFKVFSASDLYVVTASIAGGTETVLVLNSDYFVTLNANQNTSPGGVIGTTSTYSSSVTITITSNILALQATDLTNQGGFYPNVITDVFDKLTILIQQLLESVSRSFRLPASAPSDVSVVLPIPVSRDIFGWDAAAKKIVNYSPSDFVALIDPGLSQFAPIATFSALASTVSAIGKIVTIRCHTSGTVGGGQFIGVSGSVANDGGTQINSATAGIYWKRINYTYLTPLMFGAIGDNTANDTTSFQNLFNSINSNQGSRIYIPSGTYKLTAGISFTNTSVINSLEIVGENETDTILSWTTATGGLSFSLGANASSTCNKIVIKNITLTTNTAGGGNAIYITRTPNGVVAPSAVFEDVYIQMLGAGYWSVGIQTTDCADQWFNRCYIMLFGTSSSQCVFINNNLTTQSVFGAYFSGCSMNGATNSVKVSGQLESLYFTDCSLVGARDCIFSDATGTTSGDDHVSIKGCHINGKRYSIFLKNWRAIFITGTDVYSGVGVGDENGTNLYLELGTSVMITGCKFEIGALAYARNFITLTSITEYCITGCSMRNATIDGITIFSTGGYGSITGNYIKGNNDGAPNNSGINNSGSTGFNTCSGNIIEYFDTGYFGASSNNNISGNTFSNLNKGINFASGTNNNGKGNTFVAVSTAYTGSIHKELYGSATVNPASIAAGARLTMLIAVTGSVLGDFVDFAAPYDVTNLNITANVQTADIIGLYFYNGTAGAIDLPSGTWNFRMHN